MPSIVTQKTLERLDWPEILERWRSLARTPGGDGASVARLR